MKAIFLVPIENSNLVLPPLQGIDELQLQWYADGEWHGGLLGAVGLIPQEAAALCEIETTEEVIDAMIADGTWLLIEELD